MAESQDRAREGYRQGELFGEGGGAAPKRRDFSDDERAEMVRQYAAGAPLQKIADQFNCWTYHVWRALEAKGIERRPHVQRRHTLDETVFDDAENNPLSAYFLGLIHSDGCIHEMKNQGSAVIRLQLSGEAGVLVHAFRDFLKSSHKLQIVRAHTSKVDPEREITQTALMVNSNRLAAALARYGITPRKSLTATVPECMILNRHWHRGVIDGDGCLTEMPDGRPSIGVCGTKSTCDAFLEFCRTVVQHRTRSHRSGPIWAATINGTKGGLIARAIYDHDEVAHPLKKAKALAAAKWAEGRKQKISLASYGPEVLEKMKADLGTWEAVAEVIGVRTCSVRTYLWRLKNPGSTRPGFRKKG